MKDFIAIEKRTPENEGWYWTRTLTRVVEAKNTYRTKYYSCQWLYWNGLDWNGELDEWYGEIIYDRPIIEEKPVPVSKKK